MMVTRDLLQFLHVCRDQLTLFDRLFPHGVEITEATLDYAHSQDLDVGCFLHKLAIPGSYLVIGPDGYRQRYIRIGYVDIDEGPIAMWVKEYLI